MQRPANRLLSPLKDFQSGAQFDFKVFDQIVETKDKIFDEICRDIHVEKHEEIRSVFLNKRTVSKDSLCLWLESVCGLLDSFCIPALREAMSKCDEQNHKIIDSQETIIDLQAKVINNRDTELATLKNTVEEELKSVQATVQSEMKSYSSVLSRTCSAALSQKKLKSAVKSAAEEEDRHRNVVIYGVGEDDGEILEEKASKIFQEVGEKPMVKDCCRIGKKKGEMPRPVKLCLRSSDIVQQVLRKARLLREKVGYSTVYICPDRTVQERRAYKKLLEELKTKRKAEPGKFFSIRNNKVVSVSEEIRHRQDSGPCV